MFLRPQRTLKKHLHRSVPRRQGTTAERANRSSAVHPPPQVDPDDHRLGFAFDDLWERCEDLEERLEEEEDAREAAEARCARAEKALMEERVLAQIRLEEAERRFGAGTELIELKVEEERRHLASEVSPLAGFKAATLL